MKICDWLELKKLLEYNIADARCQQIADIYKKAKNEQKSGKLKFSDNLYDLKSML